MSIDRTPRRPRVRNVWNIDEPERGPRGDMSPWWAVAALGLPFIAVLLLVGTFLVADSIPGPVYALSVSCAIAGGVAVLGGATLLSSSAHPVGGCALVAVVTVELLAWFVVWQVIQFAEAWDEWGPSLDYG